MSDDLRLVALLDTVIPPGVDMPGAGAAGLAGAVVSDAAKTPLGSGLTQVLDRLPAGFDSMSADDRETALRKIADGDPLGVAAVVNLVYTAYYTDPGVLDRIERSTGYHAGPPQPKGYTLAPFDPALVVRVQHGGYTWREA